MPEKGIFRHDFIRLILVSLPPQPSLLDHSRCIVRSFFLGHCGRRCEATLWARCPRCSDALSHLKTIIIIPLRCFTRLYIQINHRLRAMRQSPDIDIKRGVLNR